MTKFTFLTLIGSTAIIGTTSMGSLILYFGLCRAEEPLSAQNREVKTELIDTVKVIEQIFVHDTVIEPCKKRHYDENRQPLKLKERDSISNDSGIHYGN